MKIIATMGPSSCGEQVIKELIRNGIDAFRLPFSKESCEIHLSKAGIIRRIAEEQKRNVEIIMDIPGDKCRAMVTSDTAIQKGQTYIFANHTDCAKNKMINEIAITDIKAMGSISRGNTVVIGDGELAFYITKLQDDYFVAEALLTGILTHNRGMVVQNTTNISFRLTDKDKSYLACHETSPFDAIYISFVNTAEDISNFKEYFRSHINTRVVPRFIPKIETSQAVNNISEILEVCDEILIGRGDLALSTGCVDFYEAQKRVIEVARWKNRRVTVGTQMIESSADLWIPNRAELSDLSHLISLGIDGVLLTSSTTVGENPVASLSMVQRLAEKYAGK